MGSGVNIAGVWKDIASFSVNIDGVWKNISNTWVNPAGTFISTSLVPAPVVPTLSHTGYGEFTITNYNGAYTYNLTLISGTAGISRVGAVITVTNVNARYSITASNSPGAAESPIAYFERKAYTYHSGGQTCNDNCQPGGGPGGEGDCWCGYRAGDLCCGGCYGQTCYDNPPVKDSTPSGYTDSLGEWWRLT